MIIAYWFLLCRSVVFKTQLAKVLVANITMYIIAIIYAYWIQTLVDYTQRSHDEYIRYIEKRRKYEQEYSQTKNDFRLRSHLKQLKRPVIEVYMNKAKNFNPAFFDLNEWYENLHNKLDLFTVRDCEHFLNEGKCSITEVMRSIQTTSAIIFFLAVHIPLCRWNVGFSLVSAFMPLMLNLRTKYWFYEKAN